MDENHHPASTSLVSPSTLLVFTPARSGRGAAQAPPGPSDSAHHPTEQQNTQNHKLRSTILNTTQWNGEEEQEESQRGEEGESDGQNKTEVIKVSEQLRPSSEGPEPEQTNPQPNLMELLSQHRGNRKYFLLDFLFTCSLNEENSGSV